VGGWRRAGIRALGAHDASMGGLGRKRGWPEVGFPRRPRWQRGGARWRGASRQGRRPSTGLIATAGGGEAVGVVGRGEGRASMATGAYGRGGDRRRPDSGEGLALGWGHRASAWSGEAF
jgi:hypothetical protein